jgi:LysR family hydrogen peroxide-inducible transcriptional activator
MIWSMFSPSPSLDAARSEVAERKRSVSGPISVGVIPTVAPYLLPSILAGFSRKWPQARVTIVEEITPLLLEKLRAGSLDVAIAALPLHMCGHKFHCVRLFTERLFAVLPRQHRLARRRTVSLAQLEGEPFLLLRDGHCFRETTVAACKRVQLDPQIVFESGQFSSILSMVSAGLGVSVVPAMAIEKRPGCCFVGIADEHANRTIGVVTQMGKSSTRVTEQFLAHLTLKSEVHV